MLILIFSIGVAMLVFAAPVGRFKKKVDLEWHIDWLSERAYAVIARVIGCIFCVVSVGVFIVERFPRK